MPTVNHDILRDICHKFGDFLPVIVHNSTWELSRCPPFSGGQKSGHRPPKVGNPPAICISLISTDDKNNGKPRSPLTNLCDIIMISRVRIACRPRPPRRYTGLKARRKQRCFLEQPRRRKALLTLQTLQGDEGYYFPSSISKYNVRFKSNAASSAVKMSDIDHAKDVNRR